ncbi:MAG: aminomethyl-transferring glycine dehydrogenase subunit GcvPA [Rhodospirillaceae bacterium]|nr:aminomethyl-transferring glycine dehydrogenase subunit GcvPA [Rhodospirillaceae bacterium]
MRYLPLSADDRAEMLDAIGAASVEDLFCDIPADVRASGVFDLPDHQGEMAVEQAFSALAQKSLSPACAPTFLGAGAYRHHIPAAVDALIQRGEFLTSYTPYQPEISQGTLQALFEFQTQVCLLTGMEVANASMYDAATACAEAALMAARVTRRKAVLISGGVHPHYIDVIRTQLAFTGIACDRLAPDPLGIEDLLGRVSPDLACVVVQTPGFFGGLSDFSALAAQCHANGVLLVVAVAEPVSLGALKPPGEMGADIVVVDGSSLGMPLSFGGPGVGLFAVREKYVRNMPGRLVGQTVDVDGRRGWVLTLSTREQHIRREKATSNICTNSGLCALAFSIHVALLGDTGLAKLAEVNHAAAVALSRKLAAVKGVKIVGPAFFNEFAVMLPKPAAEVVEALAAKGILGGVPVSRFYPSFPELENLMLVAATETNSDADMDALVAALKEVLQ